MTTPTASQPAIGKPTSSPRGLVVIGCSRRKLPETGRVRASDLYQGWRFQQLRERITRRGSGR